MITLLVQALAAQAVQTSVTMTSLYDQCLIEAAERIAAREPDIVARYRAYAQACAEERVALVGALLRGDDRREIRAERFQMALDRANARAAIWAARFLDPGPIQYSRTDSNAPN